MKYNDWKQGDKILIRKRTAILLENPEYISTNRTGLFYADVLFLDTREVKKKLMLCRTYIVRVEEEVKKEK